MTAATDVIRYDVVHRVGVVVMQRAEARNALNSELLAALRKTMAVAAADVTVDVVVLTGADPAFCAGLDLKELGTTGANLRAALPAPGEDPRRGFWERMDKPVIGAVNGVAVTGGLELALQCDWLVASERAAFGDTHARVGVMPGGGLTVLLPQAIGLRRALEMSLTGNFLSADEALAWGLVNHVVAHADLMETALKLARDVAGIDSRAVRHLLETYRRTTGGTAEAGFEVERRRGAEFAASVGFDPASVASRRDAIVQRGRGQV